MAERTLANVVFQSLHGVSMVVDLPQEGGLITGRCSSGGRVAGCRALRERGLELGGVGRFPEEVL